MPGPEDLLARWLRRTRDSAFAHYAAEEQHSRLNYALGAPAAFLAAVVGTSVFASLDKVVDNRVKLIVGGLSIGSAVLAGLQTFLRYGDRAERHRKAAVLYSNLRRDLEVALLFPADATHASLETIKHKYNEITESAPNVHGSLWKRARQKAGDDLFIPGPSASDTHHPVPAGATLATQASQPPSPTALPDAVPHAT